jgi:hypothetical protein
MSSFRITRTIVSPMVALASLALALPLASQAATAKQKAEAGAPIVKTGSVGHVSGTSAALEGSIDPRTYATTYFFEYGPTTADIKQTASGKLEGGPTAIETKKVSEIAAGFLSGYYYRLVATNSRGETVLGNYKKYTAKPTKLTKKKNEFVLPKSFAPTPLDGAFTLSGTLTGENDAGRGIVLQASPYPYRAPFADVAGPIVTSATGAFSFRVPKLSTNTRFRVATVGTPVVYSLVLSEQVTVRVTLRVRRSSRKGLVRLYGTVTPAEVGAKVFFQLEAKAKAPKGGKERAAKPEKPTASEKAEEKAEERAERPTFLSKFSTVVKRDTKAFSRFSAVVSIADAGAYRAFVELPPGPLASGHSLSISLQAAPAKKSKRKKK